MIRLQEQRPRLAARARGHRREVRPLRGAAQEARAAPPRPGRPHQALPRGRQGRAVEASLSGLKQLIRDDDDDAFSSQPNLYFEARIEFGTWNALYTLKILK